MRSIGLLVVGALIAAWVGPVSAANDVERCLSRRTKAQGKYELCVHRWLAKCYYGPGDADPAKLSKCRERYQKAWDQLAALNTSPCSGSRWVDNGNGTVTDKLTQLVWEKKTTAVGSGTDFGGDRHDVDNFYTWSTGLPYAENGTTYTDFLANLNSGGGFAGANGWRLPTFSELNTLINQPYPCATSPCIDSAFGPTQSTPYYWSATPYAANPFAAWIVEFDFGGGSGTDETGGYSVRAVRNGQ
jgi:hypothetical protein